MARCWQCNRRRGSKGAPTEARENVERPGKAGSRADERQIRTRVTVPVPTCDPRTILSRNCCGKAQLATTGTRNDDDVPTVRNGDVWDSVAGKVKSATAASSAPENWPAGPVGTPRTQRNVPSPRPPIIVPESPPFVTMRSSLPSPSKSAKVVASGPEAET